MKFNCNLCHSHQVKVIYPATVVRRRQAGLDYACTNAGHGEYYQLVRCSQCGLYFSSPRPKAADLENEYSNLTDDLYKQELSGRIITFQRNLAHLVRYQPRGDLLEIGCSIGSFLNEARAKGYRVSGIEPSLWCVQQAKKLFRLNLLQGTDKDLTQFGRQFDVITLWDVLEHVDDPLATLKRCRQALKPGGVLAFSTVDIGSLYARVMGKRWPWLMKMHIYYFDRTTIKKYLEQAGLSLMAITPYRHTVSLNYLLYKLKRISSWLFRLTNLAKKTILFNQNIYITFGLGDFMEVYARKL